MAEISAIKAREVLDSRGNPTVEVEVELSDGVVGRATAPSGASTGTKEALELRDGDEFRYRGLGVRNAVNNVNVDIGEALIGQTIDEQIAMDRILINLDGTVDKSRLGANAIVGTSMALAHANALSSHVPLYRYFAGEGPVSMPVPMLNVINGGRHAVYSSDIQEFMVIPAGFESFREALRAGVDVFHSLRDHLTENGIPTTVGDEGGFAPDLGSDQGVLDLILSAIERAGYRPGEQCFIGLDVAASELVNGETYFFDRQGLTLSSEDLVSMYSDWTRNYPILSIEDGLGEDDWDGWINLNQRLGKNVQLVGDDLYATRADTIEHGIFVGASNAVLLKPNQVGTISETMTALTLTKNAGWGTVISHRSGETEDTTISDLAVGSDAGQIKTGAPNRGERTAKYNRLLRIEEELGDQATFGGVGVYRTYRR